jgi:hypothetical protein
MSCFKVQPPGAQVLNFREPDFVTQDSKKDFLSLACLTELSLFSGPRLRKMIVSVLGKTATTLGSKSGLRFD